MKHLPRIKPIGYLKENAAQVVREVVATRVPLVITQNGVAKAVIQDVVSCDAMQQTMALLKTLALGNCQIEAGRVMPVKEAIRRIRRGAA